MINLETIKIKKEPEMQTPPSYRAIFYDIEKPKDYLHAMNKRIPESLFNNLCDGVKGKIIELKTHGNQVYSFSVVDHRTFQVFNLVENSYFVICDCKKIKTDAF